MIKLRIAIGLSVLASLFAFTFWYRWESWWPKLYDEGMALCLVLSFYVVWKGVPDFWVSLIGFVAFGFAINNLMDEVFFSPEETGWNEYVIGVLILILACLKYHKMKVGRSPGKSPDT